MEQTKQMVVKEVVKEPDRTLLYGADPRYHLIAERNAKVQVGDRVTYETCGVNFGWFIGVVK